MPRLFHPRHSAAPVALLLLVAGLVQIVPPPTSSAYSEAVTGSMADDLGKVVDSGNRFWCAVNSAGGVECWGWNRHGQLGQGNTTDPLSGRRTVIGLTSGVQQVSVGNVLACAVMAGSGAVQCWGSQVTGSTNDVRTMPYSIVKSNNSPLVGVTDVAAGDNMTCAVASGGSVWCWGYNIGGLGISGNTTWYIPKATRIISSGADRVSVGKNASCAIMLDQTVKCWGTNSNGTIGNDSAPNFNSPPTTVTGLTNVVGLSLGSMAACALRSNGDVRCWGSNTAGMVTGTPGGYVRTPAAALTFPLQAGEQIVAVSLGFTTGYALSNQGTVYRWGGSFTGPIPPTVHRSSGENIGLAASGIGNNYLCLVSTTYELSCDNTGEPPMRLRMPVPEPPVVSNVTVGNTEATVTVSAGAGGLPTSFLVTAAPSGGTCTVTAPATSCTITGLTPGVPQTFSATATNDLGTSGPGTGLTATPGLAATPGTPSVVAGAGQVTVSPQPGTGGGTATGYVVSVDPDGHSCTVMSPDTSCAITGLTNGTPYTVTTAAFNDSGPSPSGPATTVVTGTPGAPLAPMVEVGDRSAVVTVSAGTGGTPTSYTVTADNGGGSCTVVAPATSCTITGLTNGVTYNFTTTATNDAGTSGSSPATTALVDILAVPSTPSVEVGATGVTVSVASLPSGGTTQSYEVYLEPDGHRCTVVPAPSSCFIDGLSQGANYTVTTTAINGIGTSSASPALPFLFDIPGAPQVGVLTIAGQGQATVTVSAGSPGGPPASYVLYAGPSSCTVVTPATSCTLTGLADGSSYTVTASATNGLGSTTTSAGPQATLVAPDEPPAPSVVVGNASATVSVAPAATGGLPAQYLVQATTSAGASHSCTVTPPDTECSITGLTNGTQYHFTTTATNYYGSTISAATLQVVDILPDPAPPTVEVGAGGVTVSVSSLPGGGTPTRQDVYLEPDGLSCVIIPNDTSCFITGLQAGTLYSVTTTATNSIGTSPPTAPVQVRFDPPAAPQVDSVTIGLGQVTVSVAAGSGGGPASSYVVYAGPGSCTVVPPATSCVISSLTGGQTYTVTASAVNGVGATPSSTSLQARLIPPDAPPAPMVYVASGSVTVQVTPAEGGETPTSYIVTADPSGATCTVTPPDMLCDVEGLTNGTQYSFTVQAVNAYGPSTASLATLGLLAEPPTPRAPILTPGDGKATATVQPGTGGGAATDYIVTAEPGGFLCAIDVPATSCILDGLTNDVTYTVSIVANNGVGSSTVSATAAVTPRQPITLSPGIGNLITQPAPGTPSSTPTAPPTTTNPPTTTTPPAPTAPASPAVDPTTGLLPELQPGESTVIEQGVVVPVEVTSVNTTEVAIRSAGFELTLVAECASGCAVAADPDGRPVIQLEEGGGVRVSGTGFAPGSLATVWMFSEPRLLGTVTVDDDGTFSGSLPLGDLERGEHTLQVIGTSATGAPRSANLGVVVNESGVPTPGPTRLPATGTAPAALLVWAVAMVVAGALVTSRRWWAADRP